jgi:hypothetical protein
METIQAYLSEVKDFRIEKKCLHKLSDILLIGLFTYLSSGEDYEDMVLFACTHKEFLQSYESLPNGIPSHDTFRRVFSMLEPEVLRVCSNDYGKDLIGLLSEKQICLDEKNSGEHLQAAVATKDCTQSMRGYRRIGCVQDKRKWKIKATK